MKAEIDMRMATGNGANSYAANSKLQKKAILETKPVLYEAVEELCMSLAPRRTMVAADLGCSSGPNTLLFVSEVMSAIRTHARDKETFDRRADVEVQFFLNDLPGNDFNLLFRSLERLQNLVDVEAVSLPYYVAGLPGSFYTRLFPSQSVHLFHSSYCLHWRSQVPDDLTNGTHLNEANIYIWKTTPSVVVKLFQEQFKKDFELFLMLRYVELVCGGRMVLTFLSRHSEEMHMHGDSGCLVQLLAEALQTLVQKGSVEKEKLCSFNLPLYTPSVNEVKALIKQEMFDVEHIRVFQSNWDPHDDPDVGEAVLDCAQSGKNIAKSMRAVLEPLMMDHFGEPILDELFMEYSSVISKHLEKGKARYSVILVSLKKVIH